MAALGLLFVLAGQADATIIKTTVSGTITSGTDVTGVFGTANANLAGLSYTLVYSYDDTLGVNSNSQITNVGASTSPGSAVLTINGRAYSIGSGVISNSSSEARSVTPTYSMTYLVKAVNGTASANITDNIGTVVIFPTNPFSDSNWESSYTYTSSTPISNVANGFTIGLTGTNSYAATGLYNVTSITQNGTTSLPPAEQNKSFGSCSTCQKMAEDQSFFSSAGVAEGNPINAATGNKYQAETDYVGASNTGLALTRFYNSQDTSSSGFGSNWHSTWHRGLTVSGSTVTVTRADGQTNTFTKNASGAYVADADVTSRLVPVPSTGTQTGWQLTLDNDTVEAYSLAGLLQTVTTRAGLVTTLTYNGSNQLTTVTGPFGHQLTFTYNAAGFVNQMTTPDTKIYAYTYDTNKNLTSVTYPDTKVKTYVYGNTSFVHALTGITDELNNGYASYTYDSSGRATISQHAGGAGYTTVAYNTDGTRTVTDALVHQHVYTFTNSYNVQKPASLTGAPVQSSGGKAFTYDANGFIASRTDWNGNITTYVHDANGNETSRTEASGTSLARTIATTWHATYHLPTQMTEPGRTTAYTYDAKGNMLTKTVTAGTLSQVWTYTYNTAGQVLTAKDPNGNVTTYTYDAKGDLASVKDALNHTTNFTSYDANGRLLSATDPNGLVTTYTYDLRGRMLTKTAGTEATTYTYDAAGNKTKVTRPDGSYLSFTYDAAHRLTKVTDALNNYITYALDNNGNVLQKQVYDPTGTLQVVASYTYDQVNHLLTVKDAYSNTITYTYDSQGNRLTAADPLSRTTKYTYDALNRMATSMDPSLATNAYTYDALNHVTSIVTGSGSSFAETTSYTVNGINEQTGLTSPDAGATTRTFDTAGNVLTSTDARSQKMTYTYDALNRVKTATGTDGKVITYTYDAGTYGIGHLTSMVDSAGTTTWTYNINGHLLTKAEQITTASGTITLTTTYAYNTNGQVTSVTYPSGKVISYTYDAAGRVSKIAQGTNSLASTISYWPFGIPTKWTQSNGVAYTRTLDHDGRLTGIAIGTSTTLTYTLDAASQITGLAETGQSAKTFGYGQAGRINKVMIGTSSTTSYVYNAATGSRMSTTAPIGTTTYAYQSGNNRLSGLTGATVQSFTYDAAGNTLTDGVHTFAYDSRGRLISSTASSITTSFGVNGLGQRISKTGSAVPSGETEYVYDENGNLMGEYGPTGTPIEETVYFGSTPIATFVGSSIYAISADNINAPHIIANSAGTSVWFWDHLAFGDNAPNTNPAGVGTFTYNLRFPGQVADAETGLFYNNARDYNPTIGRYTQADPLGLGAGQSNLYAYVDGKPTGSVDPMGLQEADKDPMSEDFEIRNEELYEEFKDASDTLEQNSPKMIEERAELDNEVRQAEGGAAVGPSCSVGPKPSPNFITPTNSPQLPPTTLPPGYSIRIMPPTAQYPNGYWVMTNSLNQPVDPTTMRPPSNVSTPVFRSRVHVPLPSSPGT